MQKTEVVDIIYIFIGQFWLIFGHSGPKNRSQFFRADFFAKNRLEPYSREDLGLV
jgi:hypothetical protein